MITIKVHIKIFLIGLLLLFGFNKVVFSQNYTPQSIKTAYILNFIKLITWGNEDELTEYNIGIYDEDSLLYKEILLNTRGKSIKGLPIKAHFANNIDNPHNYQVLYISSSKIQEIKTNELLQKIHLKNTLLVTDEFEKEKTMINFISRRNTILFEINEPLLESENFKISGLLLTMSKSKTELKEMYLQTEQMLINEKKIVEQQNAEIAKQKALLNEQLFTLKQQQGELELQEQELIKQRKEIESRNLIIQQKQDDIEKQSQNLLLLKTEAHKYQQKLQERIALIELQEKKIKTQTQKINAQLDVLKQLNDELDKKIDEINKKNDVLNQQDVKIYNQRLIIFLALFFIALISAMVFLTYRAYRAKANMNKELFNKNEAIIAQNAEIKLQQEEILSQKEEIERQKEDLQKNQEEIHIAYRKIEEKNNLLEIRNRYITDGIQYAQRIQESIFPSHTLIKSVFPESFILFLPKDILSGDFYFFDKTFTQPDELSYKNEEIVFFSTVDCTGHGVPGALMSIVGYNLLNQAINEYKILQPSKILDFLNSGILNTLRHNEDNNDNVKDGMDIALCALNRNTLQMEYAGAFNPLYLFRNEELIEFKPDIRPIGGTFGEKIVPFQNHIIKLQKGDIIYLFTDGYADQFGGNEHSKFMRRRLRNLFFENHKLPMNEQKQILKDIFFQWKGDLEQYDDVLIMGFKI